MKATPNDRKRKRRWYAENRERECRRFSAYRREHRERLNAGHAAWRAANPDYHRKATAEYRQNNPNYQREWRARKKLRDAWLKFAIVCAAGRSIVAALEVSP